MTWPIAFIITQVTEILIALMVWKTAPKHRVIALVFLASAITHPIVWFVMPGFAREYHWDFFTFMVVAESYAYGVEILWYFAMKVPRPIFLSCVANSGSFGLGLLIHECIRSFS